jgi:hypothetical protein
MVLIEYMHSNMAQYKLYKLPLLKGFSVIKSKFELGSLNKISQIYYKFNNFRRGKYYKVTSVIYR